MKRRTLTLVVGRRSRRRDELVSELIQDGDAVIVCTGPPHCILEREDRCPMVVVADRTAFSGTPVPACARASRAVLEPDPS